MNNWHNDLVPRDCLLMIAVDVFEAFEHVSICPEEVLCQHNQVQQKKVQDEGWISDHQSKRACTGIEICDFSTRLEEVIEEHNDQLKISKDIFAHADKFIQSQYKIPH
eukprot:560951-Ditylum_brightwellii.AAC.1